MQHRQQGLAWCGGALGVVRRVRAIDRMGVTRFDLVISVVVGCQSIARRGSVGCVGGDDRAGLGMGAAARRQREVTQQCLSRSESSPVMMCAGRAAGVYRWRCFFSQSRRDQAIRSPAVAVPPDACNDRRQRRILKFSVVDSCCDELHLASCTHGFDRCEEVIFLLKVNSYRSQSSRGVSRNGSSPMQHRIFCGQLQHTVAGGRCLSRAHPSTSSTSPLLP